MSDFEAKLLDLLRDSKQINHNVTLTISNKAFDELNNRLAQIQQDLREQTELSKTLLGKYTKVLNEVQNELQIAQKGYSIRQKFSFKNKNFVTTNLADSNKVDEYSEKKNKLNGDVALLDTKKEGFHINSNSDETLIWEPGELSTNDVTISDVTRCEIYICNPIKALRLRNVRDSLICAPCVAGSCFVNDCQGLSVAVTTNQIRIHDSKDLQLWTFSATSPIIEGCHNVLSGPFYFSFPGMEDQWKVCGIYM